MDEGITVTLLKGKLSLSMAKWLVALDGCYEDLLTGICKHFPRTKNEFNK